MSIIIGSIIGIVIGLTGAGGALIAIPLFLHFLDMSLKEATVYSLLTVIIASLLNFFYQRKYSDYKLAMSIVLFSSVGSFLTNPLKSKMPEIYVALMLAAVSLYSLYSIWKPTPTLAKKTTTPPIWLTGLIGLLLGALTTFTGLGGGVLMLPLLIGFYGFEQNKAVATSLLIIALSSLFSLAIQVYAGANFEFNRQLLGLVFGILISAIGIIFILKKLSPKVLIVIRKVVFTGVVATALLKIGIAHL